MSLGHIPSIGARKGRQVVFTVEQCTQCNQKAKHPFQQGDYVFRDAGECQSCKGRKRIVMIYSEPLKNR